MFDEVPNIIQQQVFTDNIDNIMNMKYINDTWVCPICETDDFLRSYEPSVDDTANIDIENANSISTLSDDIKSLSECILQYSENINQIEEYNFNEVSMFDVVLYLKSETLSNIKKLIIDDLKETQHDWTSEINHIKKQLSKKVLDF
jgi:hypothetical protein